MNRFVSLCLLSFVVAITAYAQEQKPIDLSGTWTVDSAELAIKHTGNNVEARLAAGKNYCIGSSGRGFQSTALPSPLRKAYGFPTLPISLRLRLAG